MKDGLSSAEMKATTITVAGSLFSNTGSITEGATVGTVTSVGSAIMAGGSCVGLFTAGSFTATD